MLIAQLSDLHVRPSGQLYRGVVDSNSALAAALAHLNGLDRRPDLLLLSGDLVDEGRPEEYAHLRQLLAGVTIPFLVLPGNHDDREQLRTAFADHRYLPAAGPLHFCVDAYAVRIIGLDTCVPGKHHGHLEPASLEWLRFTLDSDRWKPTLIMMHHPPFASGIAYLDEYRYIESGAMEAVLESFNNVELVTCGHVHRSMQQRWAGTLVCSCPSTATEIGLQLQRHAAPQTWLGPPACLLHLWNEAQGMITHTSYIGSYPGPYPFA